MAPCWTLLKALTEPRKNPAVLSVILRCLMGIRDPYNGLWSIYIYIVSNILT